MRPPCGVAKTWPRFPKLLRGLGSAGLSEGLHGALASAGHARGECAGPAPEPPVAAIVDLELRQQRALDVRLDGEAPLVGHALGGVDDDAEAVRDEHPRPHSLVEADADVFQLNIDDVREHADQGQFHGVLAGRRRRLAAVVVFPRLLSLRARVLAVLDVLWTAAGRVEVQLQREAIGRGHAMPGAPLQVHLDALVVRRHQEARAVAAELVGGHALLLEPPPQDARPDVSELNL
mmetsp:Transcript_73/g.405  ORF Transcript_73/g.405 Transcript_73/m.405 type:complete len:234 (+) Transcript_73:569-1270(+)